MADSSIAPIAKSEAKGGALNGKKPGLAGGKFGVGVVEVIGESGQLRGEPGVGTEIDSLTCSRSNIKP